MADYVLSAKGTYDGSDFDKGISESKSKLQGFMDEARAVGGKITSALGDGVVKAADSITSAIGDIGAGIAAIAVTGGIGRALNMEQAKTMFKGLKLEWGDYEKTIMDAVDGTAFAMDAAALVAANLAASGVSAGADMEKSLNGATGVAATFGADLADIGGIYQKVAAQGKLSGEQLAQLSDRGINGLSVLSEYLGKTQAEVRDMVTSGKIDFATFSDAMYETFGESAKGANDTFTGVTANIKSNIAKIGEIFATPALHGLQQVFAALLPVIKSVRTQLEPLAATFSAWVDGVVPKAVAVLEQLNAKINELGEGGLANIPTWMKAAAAAVGVLSIGALGGLASQIPIVGGALGGLFGVLGNLAKPAGTLRTALSGVSTVLGGVSAPALVLIGVIAALGAAFVALMVTNEDFRNTIAGLVGDIGASLAPAFQSLQGLLPSLQSLFQTLMGVVEQLAPAILELVAAIAPVVSTIVSSVVPIINTLMGIIGSLLEQITGLVVPIIEMVTATVEANMPQIQAIIESAMSVINTLIQTVWPHIQAIITAVLNGVLSIVQAVWPLIETIISSAMAVIQSVIDVVSAAINGDWDGFWNAMKGLVLNIWNGIKAIVTAAINAVKNVIMAVVNAIKGVWDAAWNAIGQLASHIWSGIKATVSGAASAISGAVSGLVSSVTGFFSSMWSSVTSKVSSMWSSAKSAFSSGVSSVVSTVSGLPGKIKDLFAGAGSWLVESGRSMINGLVEGIQSAFSRAKDVVSGGLSALRGLFPFSPAKEGPFSGHGWVIYSGKSIMDAMAEGAMAKVPATVRAFEGMTEKMRDALQLESGGYSYSINGGELEVHYNTDAKISGMSGTEEEVSALRLEVLSLRNSLGRIIADNAPVVTETERQAARRYRRAQYA